MRSAYPPTTAKQRYPSSVTRRLLVGYTSVTDVTDISTSVTRRLHVGYVGYISGIWLLGNLGNEGYGIVRLILGGLCRFLGF